MLAPLPPANPHLLCGKHTDDNARAPRCIHRKHGLVVSPSCWVRFSESIAQCDSAAEPSHLAATHEKHMAWSSPAPGLSRFKELMATKA